MNYLKYIFVIIPFLASAQIGKVEQDSTDVTYIIIEGDSIPKTAIDLDEVMLLHKLEFDSKKDRIRYLILRRKTIKVYPYAKLASERLDSLTKRLKTITKKRQRKRYTKHVQKYIEVSFQKS